MGQTANSSDSGGAAAGILSPPKQGTTQQVASSLVTGDKGIKNTAKSIFSAMPLDDDRKTRLAGQVFGALDGSVRSSSDNTYSRYGAAYRPPASAPSSAPAPAPTSPSRPSEKPLSEWSKGGQLDVGILLDAIAAGNGYDQYGRKM